VKYNYNYNIYLNKKVSRIKRLKRFRFAGADYKPDSVHPHITYYEEILRRGLCAG
jgi:hypothetical protein